MATTEITTNVMKVLDKDGLQQVLEGLGVTSKSIQDEVARVDIGARLAHELGWGYDSVDYYDGTSSEWRATLLDITRDEIIGSRKVWKAAFPAAGVTESGTSPTFENNAGVTIAPMMKFGNFGTAVPVGVDTSEYISASSMFHQCSNLKAVPQFDTKYATQMDVMFRYCTSLKSLPPLDTGNCTNFHSFLTSCSELTEVQGLDMGKAATVDYMFASCPKLRVIKLYNLGANKTGLTIQFNATAWGLDHPEGRQSLIDSLLTNSYDRPATSYDDTFTVVLSDSTKALLEDDELAAITAKGFTIA